METEQFRYYPSFEDVWRQTMLKPIIIQCDMGYNVKMKKKSAMNILEGEVCLW